MAKFLVLSIGLLSAATVSDALSCSIPGLVGGQCVDYFSTYNCDYLQGNVGHIGKYGPDCSGKCYQYDSYKSIMVTGDGTHGTNCAMYSDVNCRNKIGESGNQVSIGGRQTCLSAQGGVAKSMKCYFNC